MDISDGERLPLTVKDMGACEIYPQTIQHNPNGRFVVVCGDGEYIIYTAMTLRNKAYGSALQFVWAADSNLYATRESGNTVKLFKNFKEVKTLKPDHGCDAISGGAMLGVRSTTSLTFYDWESLKLVRRVEISAKQVIWSEAGDMVAITTDESFYILKYNADVAANASGDQQNVYERCQACFNGDVQTSDKTFVCVQTSNPVESGHAQMKLASADTKGGPTMLVENCSERLVIQENRIRQAVFACGPSVKFDWILNDVGWGMKRKAIEESQAVGGVTECNVSNMFGLLGSEKKPSSVPETVWDSLVRHRAEIEESYEIVHTLLPNTNVDVQSIAITFKSKAGANPVVKRERERVFVDKVTIGDNYFMECRSGSYSEACHMFAPRLTPGVPKADRTAMMVCSHVVVAYDSIRDMAKAVEQKIQSMGPVHYGLLLDNERAGKKDNEQDRRPKPTTQRVRRPIVNSVPTLTYSDPCYWQLSRPWHDSAKNGGYPMYQSNKYSVLISHFQCADPMTAYQLKAKPLKRCANVECNKVDRSFAPLCDGPDGLYAAHQERYSVPTSNTATSRAWRLVHCYTECMYHHWPFVSFSPLPRPYHTKQRVVISSALMAKLLNDNDKKTQEIRSYLLQNFQMDVAETLPDGSLRYAVQNGKFDVAVSPHLAE